MIPKLSFFIASAAVGLSSTLNAAEEFAVHSFQKLRLESHYWSEGANFGDLNQDGRPDAVSGPYWWEGPDFKKRHEIYPSTTTFVLKKPGGGEERIPGFEGAMGLKNAYSTDNFFSFIHDFNRDGWNDVLVYGIPGTPAWLYLNPGRQQKHWERKQVFDAVDNESPAFLDINGDGKPEIVCNSNGYFGYASPNWADVTSKWIFKNVSEKGSAHRYTHGLGVGDVNGDGKQDILEKDGWLEQVSEGLWKRHPVQFSPGGGAQMHAYDVNGDGLQDVITSVAAHGYGLAWYEQKKERGPGGDVQFQAHIFMNKEPRENRYGVAFSQLHAVELVDMDGDGLKDIVTGKCFWAHGPTTDPGAGDAPVIYWFKLVRSKTGLVDWVPHLIDADSGVGRQIGVADVNADGRPDLIVGNKKGTFVFLQEVRKVSKAEWDKTRPVLQFPEAGDK